MKRYVGPPRFIHPKRPGRQIQAIRKSLGLSQNQLAIHLGISTSRLRKLEQGSLAPSASEWIQFCRTTFVDLETYLHGYAKRLHMLQLQHEIEAGSFPFPVTPGLIRSIRRHVAANRLHLEYVLEEALSGSV